jgi:hypothetical protein
VREQRKRKPKKYTLTHRELSNEELLQALDGDGRHQQIGTLSNTSDDEIGHHIERAGKVAGVTKNG